MAFYEHFIPDIFATNFSSSFLGPFNQGVSSAFLFGSETLQTLFGYPDPTQRLASNPDLDSFISNQTTHSIDGILCNIGSGGCRAGDVSSGIVIASPDREDPPCKSY